MSSHSSNKGGSAVRYTEKQKKEIVDFVLGYNAANGRGGQAKAIQQFKVTAVTLAAWLKNAAAIDKPAKQKKTAAQKAVKAPAVPVEAVVEIPETVEESVVESVEASFVEAGHSPAEVIEAPDSSKRTRGKRYTDEEKKEIIDFVINYNRVNGRGGQTKAVKKFGVAVLSVVTWMKGSMKPIGIRNHSSVNSALSPAVVDKISALLEIGGQIRALETELIKQKSKYDSLSASIRSVI